MRHKRLDRLAARMQQRTANSNRTLGLYIICCAIGALACGYVMVRGIDGQTTQLRVTPITPPVLLYDSAADTSIVHHKIK